MVKIVRVTEELELNGRKVTRIGGADLCELLDISPAALTDLKKRGIAVHLTHDSYDMGATVRAYTGHLRGMAARWGSEGEAEGLTAARARLAREKADEAARRNAVARGELVLAADVVRGWSEMSCGAFVPVCWPSHRVCGPLCRTYPPRTWR